MIWVVKAIASILLNLPQFDDLIAFYGAEQKVTVVLPAFILCCHACTPGAVVGLSDREDW